ncbi:MAG: pyridoxal phosphate-dependent aminotransferase [Oscillospiraceae bacterium]|jgi:aspartate/methionine/tyrosine aminotransferase|nr:pyridoxal phosphate-dependent aminotransferase [Oscillospiraceae bacterium]
MTLQEKFARLGTDNAPGQEGLQKDEALPMIGDKLEGPAVDFSHGDVNAHTPIPGSLETFVKQYAVEGTYQAYTEYRGKGTIRQYLAEKLAEYSGAPVDPDTEIILTPGTQGALFLAMGSLVSRGDKVAIVEPDYFDNRKLVEFFEGEIVPIQMRWQEVERNSGIDLEQLEEAFKSGVKLFLYSNPNNPTGVVYSHEEVAAIGRLAKKYNVAVLADELYSRQIFDPDQSYTHLRALEEKPDQLITIIGPSKTESLSGFRLGVGYGNAEIITRMEKLQAVVSLRCAGYCQAAFLNWFSEPEGWMEQRIAEHKRIRDDLMEVINRCPGCWARPSEGGSYLFLRLPPLKIDIFQFVKLCRIQANVTVTPGTEFGKQYDNFVRMNFSQDHDKAVSAVERICKMVERYRA